MNLKKYKSQGKAVEVTMFNKEEILRLLSGFRPIIQPLKCLHVDVPDDPGQHWRPLGRHSRNRPHCYR